MYPDETMLGRSHDSDAMSPEGGEWREEEEAKKPHENLRNESTTAW